VIAADRNGAGFLEIRKDDITYWPLPHSTALTKTKSFPKNKGIPSILQKRGFSKKQGLLDEKSGKKPSLLAKCL